ncbi:hypothetical protein [Saccharopolyspora sp. NPDC050642]|uniref:hypothetical protein n=1 Tax=Saccharopolyspora sp. NPDC050642 TaxID=3157099 RepID=UPI0033D7E7CE
MTRTVVVRFAFGIVSEASRQAHLAVAPEAGIPERWLTYCGVEIPANVAEVSAQPSGMPCMGCLSAPGGPARPRLGSG